MKYLCMGILAHVDAGKTTLSEGLLYTSGKLREIGRVDKGDAFLDTYELEKKRGITIFSKQALLSWKDTQVTLLDTPGHVDFSAEMERTLQVLDYAILVISGADGVQGHTRTLWSLLETYQIPVFLFINKMDQKGTDQQLLFDELQEVFGTGCVDFTDTESDDFRESAALCDEEILDSYLESGELRVDDVIQLIQERKLFPCFFGSALKMEGVKEFFDGLGKYTKSPVYGDEFGAKVFKVTYDNSGREGGNRLTFVKVTGGSLKARMELSDQAGEWQEKVNQIRVYSGEKFETVNEAGAGMICALTGLTRTYPGEGLGVEEQSDKPVLEPVLTYQILLPEGVDAVTMLPKLRQLEEEDPELHIVWKEEWQEIQAQVMGEVQMEVLQELIAERFGVEVTFGKGNIVYKETIEQAVEGVGHFEPLRHYAEVHLWLEPGEPGSGFQIATECSEDELDKNWQRLILTHLTEREHCGVLTGAALTDVKVTLIAGRAHLKHTEGGDFRQATYRAVRQGLMRTKSVLLEPYYEFRLEVPESVVGRAMTDLDRMCGIFSVGQDTEGNVLFGLREGMAVLTGYAPVATMQDYPRDVTTYTKGEGHLFCSLAGYRRCHNEDDVIAQIGYHPESDTENPPGSVFCAHGTGFYVPWNEVRDHMHIDTGWEERVLSMDSEEEEEEQVFAEHRLSEEWMDVEEIDEILARTSSANQKDKTISHKRRGAKPVGLSKPRKQIKKKEKYLLVDGYNMIFAWNELAELAKTDLSAARGKLMDILCNYQGFQSGKLILVFDAYRVQNHKTEVLTYHNILVVYTKEAETADQYIEKFAHENAKECAITVATSDGLEQIIIRGEGCRLISAREFEKEIQNAQMKMRDFY